MTGSYVGEEVVVVIQGERKCPSCGITKPMSDFGLRRMSKQGPNGEDVIRNQSWCSPCRGKKP